MPRRKKQTEAKIKTSKIEQAISFIFGFLLVLGLGWLGWNWWNNRATKIGLKQTSLITPTVTPSATQFGEISPTSKEYVVKRGDSLWKIAEQVYGSGYNWVDLANANRIKNPNLIVPGQKLKLPKVKAKPATGSKLRGQNYTVVAGDWLSKIAWRAYGDPMLWTKIYQANKDKIKDPNLIEPGWVLYIPE